MKDLYESLHEAHELDEETTTLEADFQRMKKWIEETDPTGIDLAYDGPFIDYVNEVYGTANEKVSEDYDEELYIEPSIQAGRGGVFMYGWGSEISWDFEEECDELLEFAKEATTHEEFLNSVTGYIEGKASTLADTAPYEEEDDDEYDDEFEEGLLGTAIQAAKNLNPLNLFEGEGADTTRAIVDILDKTSAEDKPTWVKAVKDVVDVIPDEYMDNLFDIAKEKLSDVQVSEEDKTKIVDAAGVPVEGAQEANTVGKILSLFDITEWDPKTLKTYIVSVLAIVALIEPTPILEIITGIITLLPPEAVKAILTVTNMIGNPVGAAATLVNRAMKSRGSDDLEESFNVGDRVKQTWANPYNVGEVIDTKYDPEKGNLVQVKWDYSDGPEIEWLNCDDVSPYNEEDEKAGYYEGLFDKPKKNRHTDENGNPVLTKLDPPPEGFFDDEAPKLYKAEPAKHKRRHSIFGNKKKPAPAGDPLDDLFDDEF